MNMNSINAHNFCAKSKNKKKKIEFSSAECPLPKKAAK